MDADQKQTSALDELEQAYKQTISTNQTTNQQSKAGLDDEKIKISELLSKIAAMLEEKKIIVEKKLADLKTLKAEIEAGLEELKQIEAKKDTLQKEFEKIERLQKEELQIENDIKTISESM